MELEDKTKILEEVEAQFDVDQSRHQNLMTQTSGKDHMYLSTLLVYPSI